MLASLWPALAHAPDSEVVLVDDGSTAETRLWLQEVAVSRPDVRVALHEHNRGYAAAVMTGLNLARGARICLLNSDLLFEPGWLTPMLDALGPPTAGVGIVGNRQYRVDDGSLDHAGVVLTPDGQFAHLQQEPGTDRARPVAVTGACVLMHREAFERVGGLDSGYRNGCEDVDLCFKLRRAGLRVVVAQASTVRHHVSLSRGRAPDQNEANSRRLFSRWRPEIKRELTTVWKELLASGRADSGSPWIEGELTDTALAAPNAMAGILAEQIIRRQEARWARKFGPDPHRSEIPGSSHLDDEHQPGLVSAVGLGTPRADGAVRLRDQAVIRFTGPMHTRNLYVCGRVEFSDEGDESLEDGSARLLIDVNGLQRKQVELPRSGPVNVGIVRPLMLPRQPNVVTLKCERVGHGPPAEVVVTHFVIDDQVVGLPLETAPSNHERWT